MNRRIALLRPSMADTRAGLLWQMHSYSDIDIDVIGWLVRG